MVIHYQEFLVYMCLSLRGKTKLPALPSPPLIFCGFTAKMAWQEILGHCFTRSRARGTTGNDDTQHCQLVPTEALAPYSTWPHDDTTVVISILFASTKVWKWMSKRFQTYGLLSVTKACTNRIRRFRNSVTGATHCDCSCVLRFVTRFHVCLIE